jgi:polynucleotide 5'-hydroxyl-kinase GRC3/NOL9
MRYELSPERTVILRGPASVVLLAGQATILCGPFLLHQKRIIGRQKQLPLETESQAELEIILGKGAEIFEIQGSTIPASWRLAAAALNEMREGKVIILGPTDVGKSTLCVYLANKLYECGRNLRIIDADIGQTDLGPPTTIGRAVLTQSIASLQDLNPDRRLFIGHISPDTVKRKLINGIQSLSPKSEKSLTIINTDGWITDVDAIAYKMDLVAEVNPDLILGLAFANELQPILAAVHTHSMKIDPAKAVLERSSIDRRSIRTDGYRRFLEGAVTSRIGLGNVQLSFPHHLGPSVLTRNRLRNLIVGILDGAGYLIQIGILIDIEREELRIYSRPVEGFRKIEVGYVKLSTAGIETGFL